MKRTICILLICSLLLAGCGNSIAVSPTQAFSFTDDLGRQVTVNDPQRVAALLGSFAHLWHLAGGSVCATADDAWDDFNLNLPEDTINLGKTKALNLELLLAAQPDFVLASTNTQQNIRWMETLENANIAVAYFDVSDFNDYLRVLKICTQITGRDDLYEENGTKVQQQIDDAISRSVSRIEEYGAPVVLSLRASASSMHAKKSEGNVLGQMLKNLGCINIADSNNALLENLSIEYILLADPQFIFIVRHGDDLEGTQATVEQFIAENPAWNELTAVKNGNVFFMEKELFSLKPNNRWGEAYEILEAILEGQ